MKCSCIKIEQTGLPYSHLIKVYQNNEIPLEKLPISKRWIFNEEEKQIIDDMKIDSLKKFHFLHKQLKLQK